MKIFFDKKGFLLAEETLKIIIAVIAIAFLIYFLVSIYFAKVNGDSLVQATSLLKESDNNIGLIITNLNEGETKTKDIIEPQGWYLFGFTDSELKPNLCAGENCICVCDDVLWEGFNEDKQQKKCDEKGVCLIVENLEGFENIKITGEVKIIQISKTGGKIYFLE